MPLHTERLLDSDMMALSTGEEFKTALRLWCKSWNQEPAASLPDDDRILAHLAGKELASWRKVKAMALRGFIKCSDGRLYHPVIAQEAINAMSRREQHQASKDGDNDRKREEREDRKLLFGALRDIGVILPAKGTSTSHLRKVAASHGIQIIVTDNHKVVTVTPKGSHNESHGVVTAKTGTGTGTYIKEEAAAASPPPTRTHAHEAGDDPPPLPSSEPSKPTSLDKPAGYAVLIRRWEKERGKAATVTS
ncbi:MAG: YdaU family protein, partial [Alcaligenaceae bacterium]|nr:YdaU family protein [Alcaligenaceae bacterium]